MSQSEAENFPAELIGSVNTESRGQKRQGEDVEELTTKGLNYQDGEVLRAHDPMWDDVDDDKAELRRVQNQEQVK